MGNSSFNPMSVFGGGGAGTSGGIGSSLTANPYTGALGGLGALQTGYGTSVSNLGLGQAQAGASGQLTPADQALVKSYTDQMNLGTEGTYSNLGLGGSTMETQDVNSNALRALAEQSNLAKEEEKLGLQALDTGRGFFGGAGSDLSAAGNEYQAGYDSLLKTIQGLGNKAAGGGTSGGGLPSWLSRVFGGGGDGSTITAQDMAGWSQFPGSAPVDTTGTSLSDVASFWGTDAGAGTGVAEDVFASV